MLGATFFIIPLFVYLGITLGYQPYLEHQLQDLNDRIQAASQAIPQSDQDNIRVFYAQLVNVKTLLDQHVASSRLFTWLEKNTLANTAYDKLGLKGSSQVSLSATVRSIDDFVLQAKRFEDQPEIRKATFQNLTAADRGGWHFDVNLTFNSAFLIDQSRPAPVNETAPAPAATSSKPRS